MLELLNWRPRIAELYAAVRTTAEPEAAWRLWRETRDRLFREHRQSPIENRARFAALPFFDYDPALRFAVVLRPADGPAFTVSAGANWTMRLRPFASTEGLAGLGRELTLY